jgi:hypothetical protein
MPQEVSLWLSTLIHLENQWYQYHKHGMPTREPIVSRDHFVAIEIYCANSICSRPGWSVIYPRGRRQPYKFIPSPHPCLDTIEKELYLI